jgi:hypothetical protein
MSDDPDEQLQEEREYATAVGFALHSWSVVEEAMLRLFIALSDSPEHKAKAAFLAIHSFETRLDVCHALIGLNKHTAPEQSLWNRLYARLRKFYKKRHEIAHFAFINATRVRNGKPTQSLSLVPFWPTRTGEHGLSLFEINERSRKFEDLAQAVYWFWLLAEPKTRKKLVGDRPLIPDLVRQLRSLDDPTRAERGPPSQSSRE